MSVYLFSTDVLPVGMEVKQMFPLVQYTAQIEISKKTLIKSIADRNRNEYQEAIDALMACAPDDANAIIGIQVSTAAQGFNNGSYLYITYIGTPAIIGDIDSDSTA